MRYIVLSFILIISFCGISQDKIFLMSGKVLEGEILEMDSAGVKYQFDKKGKQEQVTIDNYRIYSIRKKSDSEPVVVYQQDSLTGRTYTVEQMGAFVAGEQYALSHYNGFGVILYSSLVSAASAFALRNIFAAPAALLVGFSTLIPPPKKINPNEVGEKELLKEKYFLEGYKRVVKSKRLSRGLVSSLLGGAAGVGLALLVVN